MTQAQIYAALSNALASLGRLIAALMAPAPGPILEPIPLDDEPPTTPIEPPKPPPHSHFTPTLTNMCNAIRDYEGGPGDRNYRNHNPGNARFSRVGYLAIYEPVGKDKDGFAIFKDAETGWLYLNNLVKQKIHEHPNQTLFQFFAGDKALEIEGYAPSSDGNNPTRYSQTVAANMGVDNSFVLANLLLS